MKNLTVKKIIEFRKKSERSKRQFVADLRLEVEKDKTDSGGDYWVSSVSALCNAYKRSDTQIVKDKMEELEEKLGGTEIKITKNMYQRNIEILYNYENFDFKQLQPVKKMTYQRKAKSSALLLIKGLAIQAKPSHVFTFERNGVKEIGAIWFIAKLGGYKKDELSIFADILYRYLKIASSGTYVLNPDYCLAVDVVNAYEVNYAQIQNGEIPEMLVSTLTEIKKFMN